MQTDVSMPESSSRGLLNVYHRSRAIRRVEQLLQYLCNFDPTTQDAQQGFEHAEEALRLAVRLPRFDHSCN